ncbi:MAG: flavodoxin-dependent (E)-4-hydroxy-3-methylbut-2-enyl-diphosphate synthase [Candidatus Omnitrophota bacterium]
MKRRNTRTITVGKLKIGSKHPVSIQSMLKTDISDICSAIAEARALEEAGCELIRVAVKEKKILETLPVLKQNINIPICADIHFDYKLAVEAIERGADKIRINPGNIKKPKEIRAIIDCAKENKIPIRIGINSGSTGSTKSSGMVKSLLEYLAHFERENFHNIIISIKSSDVKTTVDAYRKMALRCDYPFHLGLTSTGPVSRGKVKSSICIGALLLDGIGDTIRVSLTAGSKEEVASAKDILSALDIRNFGPKIISCPTCGRCQVNLVSIVNELSDILQRSTANGQRPTTIAVMGCEVNGPGEAKHADIGIAFGKGKGAIFREGKIIKTVKAIDAVKEIMSEIKNFSF